ncbi:hypothetical protein AAES_75001 [Amazona aestiva]|uniref:Uncharacterized protein n=1 Tax=Amazona aestiva TaxID=12930 RepID=A0A0Q3PLZ2_AMAAE|nr:hypothetical protein AAES_75001 [Amazona aestiva]
MMSGSISCNSLSEQERLCAVLDCCLLMQEGAGDHAALSSKVEEEDLDSDKEQLVVREPASTAAAPAPVTSTAASFESSEGFEWPLGTLETCLLIVMGISMLPCMQSVFYPQPFRLVPKVKQGRFRPCLGLEGDVG